jgi:hypothetical protein
MKTVPPQPEVASSNYVTIGLAATLTGLSPKAIEAKIQGGVWLQGREYRKAPDGRLYVNVRGFEAWVETT